VDCEEYREALSARLDNEEEPKDARQPIDLHLEYCLECALWYDDAALITRRTRTTAAVTWPDVTDAVLARTPSGAADTPGRLRACLGVVGALLGVSGLLALATHGAGEVWAGYDTAAWNLGLAAGFGAVAARRVQPAGLVPLLAAFVAVLSFGHLSDLLAGRASTGGIVTHVLAAAGLVLVVLLGRMPPARRGPIPPATASGRVHRSSNPTDESDGGMPAAIRRIEPTKAA
jgi:predicted anti-sigma-YlaC factor YlaD